MPVFEYSCNECRANFAVLLGVLKDHADPECPVCGSPDLTKLVSRFAFVRSGEGSFEDLAGIPGSTAALLDDVKHELGEDVGQDLEQMIEDSEVD